MLGDDGMRADGTWQKELPCTQLHAAHTEDPL